MKTSKLPIDTVLLLLVLTIVGLGLLSLLSASYIVAEQRFGDPYFFFKPQLLHTIFGLALMFIFYKIPYQLWLKLVYPMLAICIIMLILVLIPGVGHKVGGASRWFRFMGFSFQPSEIAKLVMIFYLAYSLSQKGELTKTFSYGLLPHLLVVSILSFLILAEPDLGSALIIIIISVTMMIVAGARIWHIICLSILGVPLILYVIFKKTYMLKRITGFMDPWADPLGSGYHIIHSFYAFAGGGIWGRGPGASVQKLFYLPEPHTDFIFSILAEETGLIGVLIVTLLFLFLIFRGLTIARKAKEVSGVYLAVGCTLIIGLPAFLNMAVVTSLLPTTGLPLPFFSYGGTSLLVSFVSIGLLLNVAAQSYSGVEGLAKVKKVWFKKYVGNNISAN